MNVSIQELQLLHEAGQIETPQFVSIKNYHNSKGEVCNYLINLGTNYQNAKEADQVFLQFITPEDLDFTDELKPYAEEAQQILLERSTRNLSDNIDDHTNASKGQIQAYDKVVPNVRHHLASDQLHVFGKLIRKSYAEGSIRVAAPIRNSKALIRAQRVFTKNYATNGYITLKFDNMVAVKINGNELTLTLND